MPSTRKALLRKIHTLPSRPLRKLTQNPTFMGDAAHLAEVKDVAALEHTFVVQKQMMKHVIWRGLWNGY